jgi:hypothetical protein
MKRIGKTITKRWPVLLSGFLTLLAAQSFALQPALAAPASSYDPVRLRQMLLGIHGFDKAALESASTNAPEILMSLANDPNEQMVVRRQAVKGLRWYPEDGVLGFIEQQAPSAPRTLKRLYLASLSGFAATHPARVTAVAATAIEDPDVAVRRDALTLSDRLGATPQVKSILQSRLAREPDAGLRAEIQSRLGTR